MADEPVVVDELIPPVVPVAAPALEPVKDEPVIETDEVLEAQPHPLAPGGKRFEQVYAQSKQAQRERDAEREARIRAETELEVLRRGTTAPTAPKVYEWDELEAMIAAGQITRADAMSHRETVLKTNMAKEIKRDFQTEASDASRITALSSAIYSYVQTVPTLETVGSPIRTRVDTEFDWLVSVNGKNPATLAPAERKALELTALRNVLGPVESLTKRMTTNAEPHQGLPGGIPPSVKVNPDQKLLNNLKPREVEHYTRMMKIGKYPGGWKDVVAELKYVPPTRKKV